MKLQTTKGATPVSTPTPDPIELDSKALDDPARYGRLPYRCTIIAIVHGLGREKLEGTDGTSVDSMCSAFGGRPSNEEAGRVRYIFCDGSSVLVGPDRWDGKNGRGTCRGRGCRYGWISGVEVS